MKGVVQVHHCLGGWNYGEGESCCVGGEVCVVEVCAIVPGVWVCVLGVVPGYYEVDIACRLDLTPKRDRLACFAAVDEFEGWGCVGVAGGEGEVGEWVGEC